MAALIQVDGLAKDYQMGSTLVHALRGVTLDSAAGEFVAVMGPSSSGKSTFMNLLGCLDQPSRGRYRLGEQEVSELSRDALVHVRNRQIGFVFQHFNLLARTSALDNVALSLLYSQLAHGSPPCTAFRRSTAARDHCPCTGSATHSWCWQTSPPADSSALCLASAPPC